jgi:hypothetical protein
LQAQRIEHGRGARRVADEIDGGLGWRCHGHNIQPKNKFVKKNFKFGKILGWPI